MITTLEGNEWELFRELRLGALRDAPDAFSPTYAETVTSDAKDWQRAARRFAHDDRAAMFIARPARGLMSAVADADDKGHIGAMWVTPSERREGLGAAMLDRGIAFLTELGCGAIELSVTETNIEAIRLYESREFVLTGHDEPLRESSSLRNLFMVRCR